MTYLPAARRSLTFAMGFACLAALPIIGPAAAYEINPLKNKYHGDRPAGGFWERITETVHEDITDAAVRCADRAQLGGGGSAPVCVAGDVAAERGAKGNKYNALMRGVWWNDDPNQHLFGVHYATWVIWMDDAQGIAKKGRNWLGARTRIGPGYKMQYRSHYGDMQFLHAMANADAEPAADVQKRIIDWMEFAYAVAVEDLDPEVKLGEVALPTATNYFTRKTGWTINHLFAPKFTLGKATIKHVALGSMLHVVQDSYSRAHAARSYDASAQCPSGRVLEFHAYNHQDSGRHGTADTRASWRENTDFTPANDPVQASAQLIVFARERADWATIVRPYLLRQIFCIDADARPSSDGGFAKAGPSSA